MCIPKFENGWCLYKKYETDFQHVSFGYTNIKYLSKSLCFMANRVEYKILAQSDRLLLLFCHW